MKEKFTTFNDIKKSQIIFKHSIINLDGVRFRIKPPEKDFDGDGKTAKDGDVEEMSSPAWGAGTTEVIQPTEMGETLRELNDDSVNAETRMSSIDLKANLHEFEADALHVIDFLIASKFLPKGALAFSRQKKRLSVSVNARGRDDIVAIVAGKKERDKEMGMIDRAKQNLGMGGQKPQ